jgi:hypothetical protein
MTLGGSNTTKFPQVPTAGQTGALDLGAPVNKSTAARKDVHGLTTRETQGSSLPGVARNLEATHGSPVAPNQTAGTQAPPVDYIPLHRPRRRGYRASWEDFVSGIPSWCFVGAKVVVIDDTPAHPVEWTPITKGKVYTVSDVTPVRCENGPYAGSPGLSLEGVGEGIFFAIPRFRPAVPPKSEADDLAIFRPVLDQVREAA